jgi:hypothetical protein
MIPGQNLTAEAPIAKQSPQSPVTLRALSQNKELIDVVPVC